MKKIDSKISSFCLKVLDAIENIFYRTIFILKNRNYPKS